MGAQVFTVNTSVHSVSCAPETMLCPRSIMREPAVHWASVTRCRKYGLGSGLGYRRPLPPFASRTARSPGGRYREEDGEIHGEKERQWRGGGRRT